MKIVRIIARLNVGGPARHVVWLTQELQSDEFESVLLTGTVPEGEEDMSYFAGQHGVAPVFIPEMSRELSPKDVVSLWKVFHLIRREKPDIIHTHTAKAGTIGRAAGLLYRIFSRRDVKLVHTYHGHVFHSYYGNLKTKVFLAIERTLARVATDRIIAISEQQRSEINGQFRVGRASQFNVIPLGIDLSGFTAEPAKREAFRKKIGAADDEILVGFVGRLTEIKNIPLLLRVARLYRSRRGDGLPKLRFVIIGDGHLRESLAAEAANLGIEDVLTFAGNRNDPDVFYSGLDIVALTSLNEGTPLSLIEAMASAKPVISTAVGGVVDLVGAGQRSGDGFMLNERGITVVSNDAEGFFNGLIELARNADLQRELGEVGRRYVHDNYSKERLIADIAGLYRGLLGSSKSTA